MENKENNLDLDGIREYVGMKKDNLIFEEQLKTNTTQLIEELDKYNLTFEEPKKRKIPLSKRTKKSVNNIFNKIAKVLGE
jgi:hypothetical protein